MQLSPAPFTTDPRLDQWTPELLGPVWVRLLSEGRFKTDRPIANGLHNFVHTAMGMLHVDEPKYDIGTVHSVVLRGDTTTGSGALHHDSNNPIGHGVTRFTGSWSTNGQPCADTFLRDRLFDHMFEGTLVADLARDDRVQPPNAYILRYEELDLHGASAYLAHGEWAIVITLSLYTFDREPQLHIPELAPLRNRPTPE